IAEVLGVSLDWLVFGRGPRPSEEHVRAAIERAGRLPFSPGAVTARLTVEGIPARELGIDLLRLAGPGRAVLLMADGEVGIIPDPASKESCEVSRCPMIEDAL